MNYLTDIMLSDEPLTIEGQLQFANSTIYFRLTNQPPATQWGQPLTERPIEEPPTQPERSEPWPGTGRLPRFRNKRVGQMVRKIDKLGPRAILPLEGDQVKLARSATQALRLRDGVNNFTIQHLGEGKHQVRRIGGSND